MFRVFKEAKRYDFISKYKNTQKGGARHANLFPSPLIVNLLIFFLSTLNADPKNFPDGLPAHGRVYTTVA